MSEIISYRKKLTPQGQDYYTKIASAWHKTTQGIIETAQTLYEAKKNLELNEWRAVKDNLVDDRIFSETVISKLLGIAENKVFTNPRYQQFLPPSYATLYMMKDEDETVLIEKIKDRKITPDLEQKEVNIIFPKETSSSETTSSALPKVTISGDFTQVPKDELQKFSDILNVLKSYGIEVKGI